MLQPKKFRKINTARKSPNSPKPSTGDDHQ